MWQKHPAQHRVILYVRALNKSMNLEHYSTFRIFLKNIFHLMQNPERDSSTFFLAFIWTYTASLRSRQALLKHFSIFIFNTLTDL